MRKMTKTAVTLAAMSAMTIASASLAFAATSQRDQLSAVENPAAAANPNSGKWEGNNADGWTFTPADEKKLANTWAEIDGVWYYFHKDGYMAQDELVYLEGETYYFTPNGAMATGWYAFDKDSDVLYDYDLDISKNIDDIQNKVFKDHEDAYETVWMYFNADGKAKDDEWYQADSGLWYRFDDIVMVCGDYDHEINGARYGFAEDGHMYVGWERNYVDKGITAPNKDDKTWYWYDSNGKKFDADDNNGFGWKKIDGKWYCFKAGGDDTAHEYSAGTLITKTFFANDRAAAGNSDFYYVDSNGVMATGVVTVDKGAKMVDAKYEWTGTTGKVESYYIDSNWDVYFNNDGKAQADKWTGNRFYAGVKSGKVNILADDYVITPYADYSVSVTGYDNYEKKDAAADIKGALVKNAFVTTDNNTYYVDKYGDKVTSGAVQIGYVCVQKTTPNNKTVYVSASNFELFDSEAAAEVKQAADEIICKAYVVLDSKGIAYDDVDKDRTVTAGSKKYVSTGEDVTALNDAYLFFYYNRN